METALNYLWASGEEDNDQTLILRQLTPFSIYREAVLEEGSFILLLVLDKLYIGRYQRPDVYMEEDRGLCWRTIENIFQRDQLRRLEENGPPYNCNIGTASLNFDVTLLVLLIKECCGLTRRDAILHSVREIGHRRNKVCHQQEDIDADELDRRLESFLVLLMKVLSNLKPHFQCRYCTETSNEDEECICYVSTKQELKRIEQKKCRPKKAFPWKEITAGIVKGISVCYIPKSCLVKSIWKRLVMRRGK